MTLTKSRNVVLWTIQGLLAALFLFAGGMKLVMPVEMMTAQSSLPGVFFRFIGLAEVLGAIGLILPELLHIRRVLTPLAAAGLVIIMIGATAITVASAQPAGAVVPFVVGLLATFIAYSRFQTLPKSASTRPAVLQHAN